MYKGECTFAVRSAIRGHLVGEEVVVEGDLVVRGALMRERDMRRDSSRDEGEEELHVDCVRMPTLDFVKIGVRILLYLHTSSSPSPSPIAGRRDKAKMTPKCCQPPQTAPLKHRRYSEFSAEITKEGFFLEMEDGVA